MTSARTAQSVLTAGGSGGRRGVGRRGGGDWRWVRGQRGRLAVEREGHPPAAPVAPEATAPGPGSGRVCRPSAGQLGGADAGYEDAGPPPAPRFQTASLWTASGDPEPLVVNGKQRDPVATTREHRRPELTF